MPKTQASQARRINLAAFAPARCKPSVLPRESLLENILTVVATCRQQGRQMLEYLTGCCRAARAGTAPASLLPAVVGAATP